MGNMFSISISIDDTISRCWDCTARQVKYARNLEKNLDALSATTDELRELRNDVKRRVDLAEEQQLKRLDQVEGWLSRVGAMITEVDELIRDGPRETEELCLRVCSKSAYEFGKKVAEKLEDVAALKCQGDFEVVAEKVPSAMVDERPCEPTVGLELTDQNVWSCLREEQVGIVGLYGMGGVGKTTLLTKINNKFLNTPNNFDVVIWVVVSRDLKLGKVQEDIGEKIGFSDDKWKCKSLDQKATDIFKVLSRRKFVLLLDDLWERVDLTKIGVPLPNEQNGSKAVFTTRSEEVCGHMEAHKSIKVECLAWDEAWDLFQKKVGQNALHLHPDIPDLARCVAKECGGLPLALITVGRAMACRKTPQEWQHAIEILRKSASEFSGMGDEVFPLLKFSYDNLPSDIMRSCFLYCTLFPEDFLISKAELIYYWIGEGILVDCDDISVAQNWGYNILGILIYACLLEDKGDSVKMHDVLRDMALWIASEYGKRKDNILVQAGAQLVEPPEVGEWKGVKRMSLMENYIKKLTETPTCTELLTLFLSSNRLKLIDSSFFEFMPALRVLDLKQNYVLARLPLGITNLVSLQYLNLSSTGILYLPTEFKNFVKLRYLNLEHTTELKMIPPQVISSFSMLQVLRMKGCGYNDGRSEGNVLSMGCEGLIEELENLKYLNNLSITIRSDSAFQRFIRYNHFRSCTQDLSLQYFRSVNIVFVENMKHLSSLDITDCAYLKEISTDWSWEERKKQAPSRLQNSSMITTQTCFHSLHHVNIVRCWDLEDLPWLFYAPNLTHLRISECNKLEEVIKSSELGEALKVVGNLNLFAKLEDLELDVLPRLKSIYWNALSFVHLKNIYVRQCPRLKKLPLNSNSMCRGKAIIKGEKGWWNKLEWEDEATQNVFVPCFKSLEDEF